MLDAQTRINIELAIISALFGALFTVFWGMIRSLQTADTRLAEKVQDIEVLVAGKYVTREELEKYMRTMFSKLDHIAEKLDHKVDK